MSAPYPVAEWAAAYAAGRSIRQIAAESGSTYAIVRKALKEKRVRLRSRGGQFVQGRLTAHQSKRLGNALAVVAREFGVSVAYLHERLSAGVGL